MKSKDYILKREIYQKFCELSGITIKSSLFFKELNVLYKTFKTEKIHEYVFYNYEKLEKLLLKNFNTEFARWRYVFTALHDEIKKFKKPVENTYDSSFLN